MNLCKRLFTCKSHDHLFEITRMNLMIQEKMESIVLDTVEAFGAITEVN